MTRMDIDSGEFATGRCGIVLGMLLACVLALPAPLAAEPSPYLALSAEERAWLAEHGSTVELWHETGFPPFEFTDEAGRFAGMGAEIIALVEDRLQIQFNKRACTDWNDVLEGLKDGRCAIAPTMADTPEWAELANFTTPYAHVPVVIVTTTDRDHGLTLADLAGLRVGVVEDYPTARYVQDRADGRFEVVPVQNVADGIRRTAFGQIDAFVGSLAVASHYISAQGITTLHIAGTTNHDHVLRIGVSKKYPLLHSAIQQALNDISAAQIKAARDRWIHPHDHHAYISPQVLGWLKVIGTFVGLLIVGLVIIAKVLEHRLSRRMTELQQAKAQVEQRERQFRGLFIGAPDPLMEVDAEGRVLRLNDAATGALGYSREDIPTLDDWWETAFPDEHYRRQVRRLWQTLLQQPGGREKRVGRREYCMRCKDGSRRIFMVGASVIDGRTIVSMVDINDRIRMEDELKASADRFAALFDLYPFSCVITDMQGRCLEVNRAFSDLTGRSAEEALGRTMRELGLITDADDSARAVEELTETGNCSQREATLYDKTNASRRSVLYAARLIDWEDDKAILSTTIDVTEKKRAEEELRRQEQSLRVTLNSIGDAVIATDTRGRITRINAVAERLTGWTTDQALGQPLGKVFRILDPDTHQPQNNPINRALAADKEPGHTDRAILVDRTGDEHLIADCGTPIRDGEDAIHGVVVVFRELDDPQVGQDALGSDNPMHNVA
jgi:two-component system cell cycle sensor histidine kinase/response regulator CckA